MTENEIILRRLLWIRHGCPSEALYGDDGEMQCAACPMDFKRMSAHEIDRRWFEAGLRKIAEVTHDAEEQPGGSGRSGKF
jgi:hypothetical protein